MKNRDLLNGRLKVTTGDITLFSGDGIVNAANSGLMGGGGVDGAIHRAGGPEILQECRDIRKNQWTQGLPTGEAVATTAGRLPCGRVIHTVGPVWQGGFSGEDELLASAYRNSLKLAAIEKLKTIAFPAISTGVYGFPKDRASQIAYQVIEEFLQKNDLPNKVYLIFFSPLDAETFLQYHHS